MTQSRETPDERERPVTLPDFPPTIYMRASHELLNRIADYATAAVLADRASQSARIAALEAALQLVARTKSSEDRPEVQRAIDAARTTLAGETP